MSDGKVMEPPMIHIAKAGRPREALCQKSPEDALPGSHAIIFADQARHADCPACLAERAAASPENGGKR
jgi:hypothetical protein